MPALKFSTLDVFTGTPLVGNPVAIVHVPASLVLEQDAKQRIAREFNLSESVFLHEQTASDRENGDVRIDIFTPIAEVPFAGHPTVGTANYLLRCCATAAGDKCVVRALVCKAGRIPISLTSTPDGDGVKLGVSHDVHVHSAPFEGRPYGKHPVVSIVKGMTFMLVQLPNLEELATQSGSLLGTENTYSSRHRLDEGWQVGLVASYFFVDVGVEVDADGFERRQIRTRMFGSREDPATGSAASALCSYLSLQGGEGRWRYTVTQGVEMGRESHIFLEVATKKNDAGDAVIEEVLLSGSSVTVMRGSLEIP